MTAITEQNFPYFFAVVGFAIAIIAIVPSLYHAFRRARLRRLMRRRQSHLFSEASAKRMSSTVQHGTQLMSDSMFYACGGFGLGVVFAFSEPILNWATPIRILIVFVTTYVSYRLPALRVERDEKMRRKELERDLPAIIDLLIVIMEAGATFDDAITRLVNDRRFSYPLVRQVFSNLVRELSMSPNRQVAFQKFSTVYDLADLRLFSSVLLQSEMYGTPISNGLRGLAHEIRERQFHNVEAASNALGPKLTIPMTLFFLPLIFIVVLAPTVIRAFHLP